VTTSILVEERPLVRFTLRRADDALVLGHRLSEWCGHGPTPEEDIALANLGLDLLGQARALYTYAGETEGAGHDEDDLAYLRDDRQYRNLLLLEQPNGDFAQTIVRHFLYAAYADPWWRAMCASTDPTLAAIAAKAEKELAYHLRHSAEWLIRLGDGTEESHRRAQSALDLLFPYHHEMFDPADDTPLIQSGVTPDPATIRPTFDATLGSILAEATLIPPDDPWTPTGGRTGRHSEHLGFLLAEMQHLQRTHPGAQW
jgi:ring-1,2-phenylacetyl-CoA epoxidase subunit PaaC